MDDIVGANTTEEAWEVLNKGLREAQAVLDQNRFLIRQADDNHRSLLSDKIADNVSIINQMSANISKILEIYSDMSLRFSAVVLRHRRARNSAANDADRPGN